MWIPATLAMQAPDAKKMYDNIADLLGPIGTPALDELLERVWLLAIDNAEKSI